MYEEFKIPFWCNTRPEHVTADRLTAMKSVNSDRISFGLECGNQEYRRKVLTRRPTNDQILGYFETIADSGIAFSVNNIVGFPDETREMIFETIEVNRQLRGYDSMTVSMFTPYHGTKLRDLAIQRGYLDPEVITTHTTSSSLLNMPQLSSVELDGLIRTFMLYVRFPKEDEPKIRLAEEDSEEGNKLFANYQEKYRERFFRGNQDEDKEGWEEPTEYAVAPQSEGTDSDQPWGWNCGAEQREYAAPPGGSIG